MLHNHSKNKHIQLITSEGSRLSKFQHLIGQINGEIEQLKSDFETGGTTPIRNHISNMWDNLTRNHDSWFLGAMEDERLPHTEGDPYYLYISDKENRAAVEQEAREIREKLIRRIGTDDPPKRIHKGNVITVTSADEIPEVRVEVLQHDSEGKLIMPSADKHGLLYLPHPYIVPGVRYNEMYDWDTAFVGRGLLRDEKFKEARWLAEDMLYQIEHYGTILNGNRTYYMDPEKSRSQPPLLTAKMLGVYNNFVPLEGDNRDRVQWLKDNIGLAVKHHEFWVSPPHLHESGLSMYNTNRTIPSDSDKYCEPGHYESALNRLMGMHYKAVARDGVDVTQLGREDKAIYEPVIARLKDDYQARKDLYYVEQFLKPEPHPEWLEEGNPIIYGHKESSVPFDKEGNPVLFDKDGDRILFKDRIPVGFIKNNVVVAFDKEANPQGFDDGGSPVGFIKNEHESDFNPKTAEQIFFDTEGNISGFDKDRNVRGFDKDRNTFHLTDKFMKGDWAMRESGFDPSRRFGFFNVDIVNHIPVCLNSLRYKMETELATLYQELAKAEPSNPQWAQEEKKWLKTAAETKEAMQLLWDKGSEREKQQNYQPDIDGSYNTRTPAFRSLNINKETLEKYRIPRFRNYDFATGFFPMWAGVATKAQAEEIANDLCPKLIGKHGLLTSTRPKTGSQWDYPIMWAPLQVSSIEALEKYGYYNEALKIGTRFMNTVIKEYERTGHIWEKYDGETGTHETWKHINMGYATNDVGFAWTNSSALEIMSSLPRLFQKLKHEKLSKPDVISTFVIPTRPNGYPKPDFIKQDELYVPNRYFR